MRKKFRSALVFTLSLVLIALCANIPAAAAEEKTFLYPYHLGDVDGNGKITASDARTALRMSARIEKNVTGFMKLAANYDGDAEVTAADARKILRVSASLEKRPYDEKAFSEALNLYAEIMNNGKADKPGFSTIYYMNMPSDKENRQVLLDGEVTEDLDDLFPEEFPTTTREDAMKDKTVVAKGSDMSRFPLFDRGEGALSAGIGPEVLKSASVTTADGNKKIQFVLNDELNPQLLPEDENGQIESFTSAIFLPLTEEMMFGDSNPFEELPFAVTISFRHFNCTATIEYDPVTKQIESLRHDVNISMLINMDLGDGSSMGLMQNIYSTYEWFDFTY
ncbi:MAG: dockerin type I repeat-containing protein [Oscillospiraceae bacterium]|nr:dockerin type I repeat-containing protein [Oscillospiraceae bacterium]